MAKTRLIFYPSTTKKSGKTGKTPIYLRLLHEGVKAEYRLNVDVDDSELSLWNERMMCFDQKDNRVNKRMYAIQREFELFEIKNNYKLRGFTSKEIIKYIVEGEKPETIPITFVKNYFNDYFLNIVMPNKAISKGTKKNYKKAINHLNNFLSINKLEKLSIQEFDHKQAFNFKIFLTSDYKQLKKIGMTNVSASSVIKKIKVVFGNALDSDVIKKNPFKNIKLETLSPPKPKLSINEVAKIFKKDLTDFPIQELYRDIFLFSLFTGLAYGDVIKLSRSNIKQTENGLKLSTYRGKTNMPVEQLLVSYAEAIFYKYKDCAEVKICNTVLPFRSLTHLNIQVKILAEMCEIPINLSSHIARHSCRQLLGEAGIQDLLLISRIMGWGTGNRINAIYYSITENLLNDAKQKFEQYLNKYII